MSRRILVIEDNLDIARLVQLHLRDASYRVDIVDNGAEGLDRARTARYDLIILDIMLPQLDGLELCRRLRADGSNLPILMLTAKTAEVDRVLGLEIGADDYLTKPFSIHELVARVNALFRRIEAHARGSGSGPALPEPISAGGLEINPETRGVTIDGHGVDLTAKEFDLLLHLARHAGRVYSRTQLLDEVWGYGHDGYEHTVNSHINRLRAKVERNPAEPEYVLTVWGVGYKFTDRFGARSGGD
ncbi:MAG: response regulator transcription factor [Gammaproteobacteria bacterium]|nr:response regulator transcription factor [Gammaproteobacteria bacterium]